MDLSAFMHTMKYFDLFKRLVLDDIKLMAKWLGP